MSDLDMNLFSELVLTLKKRLYNWCNLQADVGDREHDGAVLLYKLLCIASVALFGIFGFWRVFLDCTWRMILLNTGIDNGGTFEHG